MLYIVPQLHIDMFFFPLLQSCLNSTLICFLPFAQVNSLILMYKGTFYLLICILSSPKLMWDTQHSTISSITHRAWHLLNFFYFGCDLASRRSILVSQLPSFNLILEKSTSSPEAHTRDNPPGLLRSPSNIIMNWVWAHVTTCLAATAPQLQN